MDNKKVENKKHMSNKKKFWLGMGALAAVGVITATVAYFNSAHQFINPYKTRDYSVETKNIIDVETANSMYSGQTVNTDITVENKGEIPILTRITYVNPTSQTKIGEDLSTYPTDKVPYAFNLVAGAEGKFLYNNVDGCYYYKGILADKNSESETDEKSVQHLDSVTCTAEHADTHKTDGELYLQGDGSWSENSARNGSKKTTVFTGQDFELSVIIETVQATDKKGEPLKSDEVIEQDADGLRKYWTEMSIKSPLEE